MKLRFGPLALTFLLVLLAAALPPQDKLKAPKLTAEDVLARYQQAIGGARLDQVKTIVKKAETTQRQAHYTSITYRRAPNLYASFFTDSSGEKSAHGFDGKMLWALFAHPPKAGYKVDLTSLLENAPITTVFLLQPYKKAKFAGMKKVGDRSAYTVETIAEPNRWVYYFDSETLLLLRSDWSARHSRAPGYLPGQEYLSRNTTLYSDWREVNGVKLPFEIRDTWDLVGGPGINNDRFVRREGWTRILEYQIDVPLEDAVFAPPPASVTQAVK